MKENKKMTIVIKILVVIIALIPIAVIAVTGVYLPKSYNKTFDDEYYLGFEDVREQVIAFGLLAPNSHNVQSWNIILDDEHEFKMNLYLNEERLLPFVDPNYEQLIFSCGTFISYMEAGAQKLGYNLNVQVFPNGELPNNPTIEEIKNTVVAEITVVENSEANDESYDIIAGATKRVPYIDSVINKDILSDTFGIESEYKINLISDETELDVLKDILIKGVLVESKNEDAMMETRNYFRYTTYQKNKQSFGLSLHSDNPSTLKRTILEFMATIFGQSWEQDGEFWYARDSKNLEKTNYFGMIVSKGNSRTDQLKTGILFGTVCLKAVNNKLEIQPSFQVLETYESMNDLNQEMYNNFTEEGETIQIIFRIGETKIEIPSGFRLDVKDIVE
jgi:hypothetical protein